MNDERCVRWLKAWIALVALAIGSLLASGLWLARAIECARPSGGEVSHKPRNNGRLVNQGSLRQQRPDSYVALNQTARRSRRGTE
jgi:hypothetical protein